MKVLNTYQQNRMALNDMLYYINTDEFIELPTIERHQYLKQMEEQIRLAFLLQPAIEKTDS